MVKYIEFMAISILLLIDQVSRFANMQSVWYQINMNYLNANFRVPLLVYGLLVLIAWILIRRKYYNLYGLRVWFSLFFIYMMAAGLSTTIDRIIYGGGRDFIPLGDYVANLGDLYYVLAMIFLTIELATNKKGRLRDFWK